MRFLSYIAIPLLTGISLTSIAALANNGSSSNPTGELQIQIQNMTAYTAAYRDATIPYFVHLKSKFPTLPPQSGKETVYAQIFCENSNNDDSVIIRYDLKDQTGKIVGSCYSTIALNCEVTSTNNSVSVTPSAYCSGSFTDAVEMTGISILSNGKKISPSFSFQPAAESHN